jgi:serine/threonine protein kinase
VKKKIGAGAYGLLCAATDKRDNTTVAVKKIKDAFEDAIDCKRTLREVRLLQHFAHENVLNLRDIMLPPAGMISDWKDIYLVLELMDTDLHYIIHSKQSLTDDHIQYFIYQILRGLKAIHSAKVLHRDLKPNNLLVNKNCDLKICDFGLARGVDDSCSQQLTEYVVTRWYRAPELLVENATYDQGIDIWSVGCILAECLGRKALLPGKDYLQQLRLIIETLGQPSSADLSVIENPQAVEYIQALPKKPPVPFAALYPNANPLAIDLLEKMLVFDPRKRISASDALEHEYLRALHNVNDEPSADVFDFTFEEEGVTENQLRGLIWQQLKKFHPELGEMPSSFTVPN